MTGQAAPAGWRNPRPLMRRRWPCWHHSVEALNFQLTYFIVFVVVLPVSLALMLAIGRTTLNAVGFILLMAVFAANLAFGIVGAVKASRGEWWRYPIAIRVVRP